MAATTFSVIVPIGPEYNLPNNNQRAYWTGAMQPNSHTGGGFSEIWDRFFKLKFFVVVFFAETSSGYLGTSPGSIEMVS